MSGDIALDRLALLAGIVPEFIDLGGVLQPTSRETKLALLAACGWDVSCDAAIADALKRYESQQAERLLPEEIIVTSGQLISLPVPKAIEWRLQFEGADEASLEGRAKGMLDLAPLPSGIHKLMIACDGKTQTIRLIAAPKAAPSVHDLTGDAKHWGVNLALYGLHSARNKSMGDYGDLGQICTYIAAEKASFIGINPVHAIGWNSADVISPYSPSHRGFLNTNPIAVEMVRPLSDKSQAMIDAWREAGIMPELIDYADHGAHIRPILASLYQDFCAFAAPEQKQDFAAFRAKGGEALRDFARFECLAGLHGTDWRQWPPALQRPAAIDNNSDDLDFHIWLQWQAELQLAGAQAKAHAAGMALGLYLDLAVGARRDGAEAWGEQDSLAHGVSIGAPPDHLSPAGQNWNLAAYAPNKLAAHDYRAFRNVLARNMRHCGVLRIDHVLGLNRSFWIPDNGAQGGYIKHNFEALLAIVRIEAERNRTVIIGEDLGLVPDGFRETMLDSGVYSYSVLQYEKEGDGAFRSPSDFQPKTLACFGTHDTPSLTGFAAGRDIEWWERLGWTDDKGGKQAKKQRRADCKALKLLASSATRKPLDNIVHQALAESPVEIVAVQLDDIEAKIEAQNLPGTIDQHPNWRRRSDGAVESFAHHKSLRRLGKIMRKHRGS